MGHSAESGKVYLVGAGCGDVELLTLKAQKLLRCCQVVVYDSLVSEEVLQWTRPGCEKIYVGKRYGVHAKSQQEINELLIEKARGGNLVVRLKGGDPYVFGRGGEEFLALQEAGVCCEEVPGISSAFAVPAAAGIPVTHRGLSGSVTVVTGTAAGSEGQGQLQLDFETLAKLSGTLVILMGMHHLKEIAEGLMGAGKHPGTPCAVIMEGTTRRQRCLRTILKKLSREAVEQGFTSPAVIIIGEVAGLELVSGKGEPGEVAGLELIPGKGEPGEVPGLELIPGKGQGETVSLQNQMSGNKEPDKGKCLPLADITVGVTGTPHFVEKLSKALAGQGAEVWDMGFMEVQPAEDPLPDFAEFSWLVFTSPNGVRIFLDKMKQERRDLRSLQGNRIAVIGSGTEAVLAEAGIYADYCPERYDARHLGEGLSEKILGEWRSADADSGKRPADQKPAIFLRAQEGSPALSEEFARRNVPFVEFSLYRLCVSHERRMAALGRRPDYVVFGSAGGVRAYFEGMEAGVGRESTGVPRYVCIGEMCSRELEKYVSSSFLTAEESSVEGIVSCIVCAAEGGMEV